MRGRQALTLIELMMVILIVSILAAVTISNMRGRIDAAKWSEGKAIAGTVATSLRAYAAEKAEDGTYGTDTPALTTLGFIAGDLRGTYFDSADYSWDTAYDAGGDPSFTFTITISAPVGITKPSQIELDEEGRWIEID